MRNMATTQSQIVIPVRMKLMMNCLFTIRALGSRGGVFMLSLSAGPTHIEIAGRISVPRLIQSMRTAVRAFGIKNIIEAVTVTSSPVLEENIYQVNFLRF
jgi:hypothetical protein